MKKIALLLSLTAFVLLFISTSLHAQTQAQKTKTTAVAEQGKDPQKCQQKCCTEKDGKLICSKTGKECAGKCDKSCCKNEKPQCDHKKSSGSKCCDKSQSAASSSSCGQKSTGASGCCSKKSEKPQ